MGKEEVTDKLASGTISRRGALKEAVGWHRPWSATGKEE